MTPPPPPLSGVKPLTFQRLARLMWWEFKHTLRRLRRVLAITTVLFMAVQALASLGDGRPLVDVAVRVVGAGLYIAVLLPAACYVLTLAFFGVHRLRGRWIVGAFSKDAGLFIIPGKEPEWIICDHAARKIGCGYGKQLRQIVMPQLLAAADAADVSIRVTAEWPLLLRYEAELEGLPEADRIQLVERVLPRAYYMSAGSYR